MFALLSAEHANVPHGARVQTPLDFSFSATLRVGDRFACNGGMLRFHSARLAVQLKGAHRWRARLDHLGADLGNPRVATALQVARQSLRQFSAARPQTNCGVPIEQLNKLSQAVRGIREHDIKVAIVQLTGFGPGLTPDGDDVLIGFLAGLRTVAGADLKRRALLMFVSALVRNAAHATNAISGAYLLHACDGVFAEPLTELATHIAKGDAPPAVASATAAALAVGATSGASGVCGLLEAMTCCS